MRRASDRSPLTRPWQGKTSVRLPPSDFDGSPTVALASALSKGLEPKYRRSDYPLLRGVLSAWCAVVWVAVAVEPGDLTRTE